MRKLVILLMLSSCAKQNLEAKTTLPVAPHVAIVMNIKDEQSSVAAQKIEMGVKSSGHQNYKIYDVKDELPSDTRLILGPMFSHEAIELTHTAKSLGATMITLSNNPAIVDKNIYVYGHAPMRQTIAVLEYTISEGYTKYITFMPDSSFGRNLGAILGHKIKENGLDVINLHYSSEDISGAVLSLKNKVLDILENDDSGKKVVIILGDEKDKLSVLMESIYLSNLDKLSMIVGDSKIKETNSDAAYLYAGDSLNSIAYDLGFLTKKMLELSGNLDNIPFNGRSGSFIFKNNIAERSYSIFKCFGNVCELIFSPNSQE